MATRWRALLDSLNVTWTDTGRNTARGWISIRCPWCNDDPSEHLGINEEHGHYRCLRNEDHRGRSPYWLLKGLGVPSRDIDDLLDRYGGEQAARSERTAYEERAADPKSTVYEERWRRLSPASDSQDALDYLHRRHFPDPERTVRDFDLRVGSGRWARRLWFKLTDVTGSIVGVTGRALDDWRSPRYFTEAPEAALYLPRTPNNQHRLALLVEGPMDALRTADVTGRRRNLLVIALNGLSTRGSRRMQLTQLARTVSSFAVAFDASVPTHARERLMAELRAIPRLGKITRLRMPPEFDDPGEMTNSDIERWLSTL